MLLRGLGWIFLAMAVAVAVRDGLGWWGDGTLQPFGLGDLWGHLDTGSLAESQRAVQRLSPGLWTGLLAPLLAIPAALAFLVLGIVLRWLGRRERPAEPSLLGGGARSGRRRRRSGGLS